MDKDISVMERGLILIKKFPKKRPRRMKPLNYARQLSWPEYTRVRRGLVPTSAAEKWLIYRWGSKIFFRRSGNGTLVYRVRFAPKGGGFAAVETHVNADSDQLDPLPPKYDCRMLDYLIDRLLLGRKVSFPVPEGMDSERAALMERIWMGNAGAAGGA
jgi:hypothetical protein